jgi:hypothetical protein
MYEVDNRDRVRPLEDIPQSSIGAPIPLVLCNENTAVVAYYVQDTPADWDGTWVQVVDRQTEAEQVAIVRFHPCYARMFGPPNDEAFHGHPLASRGLEPYGAFVIEDSSWLRRLERMNSVHRSHRPEAFWRRRHFVLSFHDSTFECIAIGYSVEVQSGSVWDVLPRMAQLLD